MSEHEDRVMKGGMFSPPAGPLALPTGHVSAEHVPAHDGGAHASLPLREEVIVESLATAFSADHLTAAAGSEHPSVELGAPKTERWRDPGRARRRSRLVRSRSFARAIGH